jgi:hypothetical protein
LVVFVPRRDFEIGVNRVSACGLVETDLSPVGEYVFVPRRISSGRAAHMRHILNVIVIAVLGVLVGVPHAQACESTDALLKGSFGYTGTGALLAAYVGPTDAGPFAEGGPQTFDGKGHTTATATLSANGDISTVTVEGTYTVKSDCTGTMTLNVVQFGRP